MEENEEYRLSFFVNATHQVRIDGKISSKHPHTFEITCYIRAKKLVAFEAMEENVNQALNQLNDQYLNALPVFKGKNPTLENIGRTLFKVVEANLSGLECNLTKLIISESPVRSFIIGE